jgi:hypothetical protein
MAGRKAAAAAPAKDGAGPKMLCRRVDRGAGGRPSLSRREAGGPRARAPLREVLLRARPRRQRRRVLALVGGQQLSALLRGVESTGRVGPWAQGHALRRSEVGAAASSPATLPQVCKATKWHPTRCWRMAWRCARTKQSPLLPLVTPAQESSPAGAAPPPARPPPPRAPQSRPPPARPAGAPWRPGAGAGRGRGVCRTAGCGAARRPQNGSEQWERPLAGAPGVGGGSRRIQLHGGLPSAARQGRTAAVAIKVPHPRARRRPHQQRVDLPRLALEQAHVVLVLGAQSAAQLCCGFPGRPDGGGGGASCPARVGRRSPRGLARV